MVSTLAKILDVTFKRIQFTPDLMPSDITGTNVLEEDEQGRRHFRFVEGPIFTNILLADEINRTPPKTQAALLQAMQEREVSVGQQTYNLPDPFFTIATQNPIEQEGTYPLPEAQLDRFMFNIKVNYPTQAEEEQILASTTRGEKPEVRRVLSGRAIVNLQKLVRSVAVSEYIIKYASRLVRATRPKDDSAPDFVKELVDWGAGPARGTVFNPRRQGVGGDGRAVLGGDRRYQESGHTSPTSPRQHELPSTGRRHELRRRRTTALGPHSDARDPEVSELGLYCKRDLPQSGCLASPNMLALGNLNGVPHGSR